jgi:hypothetical protein
VFDVKEAKSNHSQLHSDQISQICPEARSLNTGASGPTSYFDMLPGIDAYVHGSPTIIPDEYG